MMHASSQTERRHVFDRRCREFGPLSGMAERRIRAERRNFTVVRLSLAEWAEAYSNYYYHHLLPHQKLSRRCAERRVSENGPPFGCGERRLVAERRRPEVSSISVDAWAEAMSNYYFHFHR